ncbi:unnamed protein product, partial [Amoebophrya sp. A25]
KAPRERARETGKAHVPASARGSVHDYGNDHGEVEDEDGVVDEDEYITAWSSSATDSQRLRPIGYLYVAPDPSLTRGGLAVDPREEKT